MKQYFLKLTCCAAVSAVALAVSGGDDKQSASSTGAACDDAHTMKSQTHTWNKPVLFSKLQSAKVQSNQEEDLGEIEELLIDPDTGNIEFVVLGRGGFLGIGEKYVAVPWKAFTLEAENQFTLNVDKERLKTAPTLEQRSEYSQLAEPDYAVTIYRFYAVPIEGIGGSEDLESDPAVGGSDDLESSTDAEVGDESEPSEGQPR